MISNKRKQRSVAKGQQNTKNPFSERYEDQLNHQSLFNPSLGTIPINRFKARSTSSIKPMLYKNNQNATQKLSQHIKDFLSVKTFYLYDKETQTSRFINTKTIQDTGMYIKHSFVALNVRERFILFRNINNKFKSTSQQPRIDITYLGISLSISTTAHRYTQSSSNSILGK